MKKEKNIIIILMSVTVFIWGLDYIVAKLALVFLEPLSLLFFKYMVAAFVVIAYKIKTEGTGFIKARDIPVYVLSVAFGEII